MKKLLLLFVFLATSCSKDNCDEQVEKLTKQYEKNIWLAGNSIPAILKINAEYNRKLTEIYSNCN